LAWHMPMLLAVAPGLAMADLAVAMVASAAATVALAVVTEAVADTGVVGEPDPDFPRSRGCRLGPCRTNRFSDVGHVPIGPIHPVLATARKPAGATMPNTALGHHPATVLRKAG